MRRPLFFQLALLRERIESAVVAAARPSPGAPHVSALGGHSYSGRPVTFVLGLEEGAIFPAGLEDPVLLDSERRKIAPGRLCTSSEALDDAVNSRVRHIADLTGNVTLSYSSRDFRKGRETYPSWLVFHACRLLRSGPAFNYDELIAFLGGPGNSCRRHPRGGYLRNEVVAEQLAPTWRCCAARRARRIRWYPVRASSRCRAADRAIHQVRRTGGGSRRRPGPSPS
jgi:hypothetical protein